MSSYSGLGLAVAVFTVSEGLECRSYSMTDITVPLFLLDGACRYPRFIQPLHSSLGRCHIQPNAMARPNTRT